MDNPVPSVSIIIPAYNHALWIEQALASVFSQNLTNWELIVVDDASTDETWSVIQNTLATFASLPNKITVSQHDHNQGAPATLNEGLALAQGEYIAILNSDDAWHADRLSRLFDYSQQTDCDFVASGVQLWDKHSRLKNDSEPHWLAWYQKLQQDWQQHSDFLRTLLFGNFLITTSNFFFRRDLYQRLGGFTELRYVHDYEYALRLYQGGARMACLWDDALLNYRLHDDNTIRERPLAAQQENMDLLLSQLTGLTEYLDASRLKALRWQLAEIFRYYGEEWQTEIHFRLLAKEEELFSLIDDRDVWVNERDVVINEQRVALAEHSQWLTEHKQWVAERDRWIEERDAAIAQQQDELTRQQAWLRERDVWLTERDEMISQRDHWVAQRDDWVVERDVLVAERDAWVKERDQLISQLRSEYEQLQQSRAFRLGTVLLQPLRKLRDRFDPQKWRPEHA